MGNTAKNLCLGLTAALLATIAMLFIALSNFWCHNFQFNSARPGVRDLQVGLWYYTGIRQSGNQIFGDRENADDPLFVNYRKCTAYPPGISLGNFWSAARAFSIIATVVGGFFMILLWLSPWVFKFRPRSWRTTGITIMLLMPLFQGLTFLFWRSDQCKARSRTETLGEEQEEEEEENFLTTYPGSCKWNQGSTLNVVGIVLWFLTGLYMALTHPPAHHHKDHHDHHTTEIHDKQTTTVNQGNTMTGAGMTGAGMAGAGHHDDHNMHGAHHTGMTGAGAGMAGAGAIGHHDDHNRSNITSDNHNMPGTHHTGMTGAGAIGGGHHDDHNRGVNPTGAGQTQIPATTPIILIAPAPATQNTTNRV